MKCVYKIVLIFVSFFIIGCANTEKLNTTQFTTNNIQKRALISDHHLLISILNRPMTADQKLMQTFNHQQTQWSDVLVNSVLIMGPEQANQKEHHGVNDYSQLITNDAHSVRISGPK